MEYLLSAFWALLELIGFHYFLSAFISVKTSKKVYVISLCCAWLFPQIYALTGLPSTYHQLFSLAILSIILFVNYHGPILQKLLLFILFYILGSIIDTIVAYGACALLQVSLSVLVWRKVAYSLVVSIGKILIIFLTWVLFHIRKKKRSETLQIKWLLMTLLFPVVSLFMVIVLFHSNRNQEDFSLLAVIFSLILATANIAIIYLIQIMEKNTTESKKLALLNQQMQIQTDNILILERNYRAQRKATHEFRSQLQTIQSLVTSGEYTAVEDYITQLQGASHPRLFTVDSHHPIVDAVLNSKLQIAREQGIDVQIQVNDLSSVDISTDLLVVLFSNLLDNAIEACLRHNGERIIQCTILKSETLYISIRNTSNPVVIQGNHHIPTSKEPRENHGFGLAHVDFILNQLSAEYILSYKENWFEFASEIPQ